MKISNRRNLIAGATAVVLALTTAAFAQRGEGGSGRRDPAKMLDRQVSVMKEKLQLTPDQETKVRAILEESGQKTRALMEKYGRPERGKRPSEEQIAAMRTNRAETQSQLSQVLTADQQEQWEKFHSERGRRFRKGGDHAPKGEKP